MKKMLLTLASIAWIFPSYSIDMFNKFPSKHSIKNKLSLGSYLFGACAGLSWITNQDPHLTESLTLLAAGTSLLSQGFHDNDIHVQDINASATMQSSNLIFRNNINPRYIDLNIPYGCALSYYGTKKIAQEAIRATNNALVTGAIIGGACLCLGYKYGPRMMPNISHKINKSPEPSEPLEAENLQQNID